MSPIVIILLILIAAMAAWLVWQLRAPEPGSESMANAIPASVAKPAPPKPSPAPETPYSTETIEAAIASFHKLAFDNEHAADEIPSEHREVLDRIEATIDAAVHQPEFFPRRPMLLPKLLRAINDTESTRQELVSLIREDPSLAGNVLRRANSALYRITPAPVDSLDRAVINLGMDGLRSLMATAILQPVFRLPTGLFDGFPSIVWEEAQRASIAAEAYAKRTQSCDPLVAQLLGLLRPLAYIVLFKLALERYRETPDLEPRAEVFVRAMKRHSRRVAHLIATTWELPDPSLKALEEQRQQRSPSVMSSLGRAAYFGDLCGTLAVLAQHAHDSHESAQSVLIEQGLDRETAAALWRAATAVETDL
jgi:HD-like signal output (HDOD) protein